MFCCERKRNCFLQEIPSVYKAQKTSCRQKPDETLLTGTGINSFRSLKFKRCVELDVAARLRLNFCDYRFPSGKTRLSPDETTSRSISSGKNHDIPDGRTLRLAHQNNFGSQCATERIYRYLHAKVKRKKSHFGKQSFIECALRRPPCQSELAEGPVRRRGVEDVSGWA